MSVMNPPPISQAFGAGHDSSNELNTFLASPEAQNILNRFANAATQANRTLQESLAALPIEFVATFHDYYQQSLGNPNLDLEWQLLDDDRKRAMACRKEYDQAANMVEKVRIILSMPYPGMGELYVAMRAIEGQEHNESRPEGREWKERAAFEQLKLEAASLGDWNEYNKVYGETHVLREHPDGTLKYEMVDPNATVLTWGAMLNMGRDMYDLWERRRQEQTMRRVANMNDPERTDEVVGQITEVIRVQLDNGTWGRTLNVFGDVLGARTYQDEPIGGIAMPQLMNAVRMGQAMPTMNEVHNRAHSLQQVAPMPGHLQNVPMCPMGHGLYNNLPVLNPALYVGYYPYVDQASNQHQPNVQTQQQARLQYYQQYQNRLPIYEQHLRRQIQSYGFDGTSNWMPELDDNEVFFAFLKQGQVRLAFDDFENSIRQKEAVKQEADEFEHRVKMERAVNGTLWPARANHNPLMKDERSEVRPM